MEKRLRLARTGRLGRWYLWKLEGHTIYWLTPEGWKNVQDNHSHLWDDKDFGKMVKLARELEKGISIELADACNF